MMYNSSKRLKKGNQNKKPTTKILHSFEEKINQFKEFLNF